MVLEQVGVLLELKGANPFRVRSYQTSFTVDDCVNSTDPKGEGSNLIQVGYDCRLMGNSHVESGNPETTNAIKGFLKVYLFHPKCNVSGIKF